MRVAVASVFSLKFTGQFLKDEILDFLFWNRVLVIFRKAVLLCSILIFSINSFALAKIRHGASPVVQDTFIVKPDSLLKQSQAPTPVQIAFIDTSVKSSFDSPLHLTAHDLKQYFEEDLGTILKYTPGLFLFDRGSSGQQLGVGRHGTTPAQTKILLDGRPLYNPIYGGIDLNFIPSRFIRTMTIEQGMSSPLLPVHGEIISLETKQYDDTLPYSQVGYHKAGLGFSDVDIIFGQQATRKINFLLGGIIRSFNGRSEAYNSDLQNFRGNVQYFYSPQWLMEYSWIHNKLTRRAPGPILDNAEYVTPEAVEKLSRFDQTLSLKGKILSATLPNFFATMYYSGMSRSRTDSDFDVDSNHDGSYAGLRAQIADTLLGQAWTAGANFSHDWTNSDDVGEQNASMGSVYLMDDMSWRDKFGLRLLGSYQFHSNQGVFLSGGVSAYAKFGDFKLISAVKNSVNHPTLFQFYAGTNFIGNENLDSETHQKFSAGLNWQPTRDLEILSRAYLKNIFHPIYYQFIDTVKATFQNVADYHFFGGDCQIKWKMSDKFRLAGIFSGISSNTRTNFPQFSVISYLQYSDSFFENDLKPTIRLETRFYGERQSNISHPYYFLSRYETLDPTFVLNAHALLDFGNLKMYLTLENIIDSDYEMIYGYPMNGRTFHYGLRWEFWD